jgi:hypothetical protein
MACHEGWCYPFFNDVARFAKHPAVLLTVSSLQIFLDASEFSTLIPSQQIKTLLQLFVY